MQELKPRDMSIPDRVAVLERKNLRLQKKVEWQDERQDELIEEIAGYLSTVMDFLDGAKFKGYTFKKAALSVEAIKQKEEDKALEFLESEALEGEG